MFLAPVVVVATAVGDSVVVHEVGGKKPKKLYEVKTPGGPQFAFTDEHTLWVVYPDKETHIVERVVDGKVESTRTVGRPDWQLEANVWLPDDVTVAVVDGQVLLARCIGYRKDAASPRDCDRGVLRVDGEKPALVGTVAHASDPRALPALATPPKGFAAHIRTHEGEFGQYGSLFCTGGKGYHWTSSSESVSSVTWRHEHPAILEVLITNPGRNLVSGFDANDPLADALGVSHEHSIYVEDCTTPLDAAYSLGGAFWATERRGTTTVRNADHVVGTVPGTRAAIVP